MQRRIGPFIRRFTPFKAGAPGLFRPRVGARYGGGNTNFEGGGLLICQTLVLGPAGPPNNSTALYSGNSYTITNTAGGANDNGGADLTRKFNFNGSPDPVVIQLSAPVPSSTPDDGGAVGIIIVSDDFLTFQGFTFYFGTGSDGELRDPMGGVIASGLSYPSTFPYLASLEMFEDGTADFSDNAGNSQALASLGSFAGKTNLIGSLGQAPLTASASQTIDLIASNVALFNLPLVNPSAKTWCNFPAVPAVPEYKFFDIGPTDANVALSNSDRTVTSTHDGVNDGDFTVVPGWTSGAIPASVSEPDGNTFEYLIDSNTNDALNGLLLFIVSALANPAAAQGIVVTQDSDKNLITISASRLFTISMGAGDVLAIQIFNNGPGPTPSDASDVRFIYVPNGGTAVIFDKFRATGAFKDFVLQVTNGSVAQAAPSVLALTFDGKEDDYNFASYPPGSVDFEGDPMPSKIAAYTRNALWNDNPYNSNHEQAGNVLSLDGTRKIITCSTTANTIGEGWTVGSAMVDNNITSVVCLVCEVTTADSDGTDILFQVMGMGDNGLSYIRVREQAGDIVVLIKTGTGSASSTVLSDTDSFSNGDLIGFQLFPLSNAVNVFYYDGGTMHRNVGYPSGLNYDGAGGEAPAAWLPAAGCVSLDAGETVVLTNKNLNTDMPAVMKAEFTAGAVDILGNLIV